MAEVPIVIARMVVGATYLHLIEHLAPAARVSRHIAPTVVETALLGLDHLAGGATPQDAGRRLRTEPTTQGLVPTAIRPLF
jgi:hypothetical protein